MVEYYKTNKNYYFKIVKNKKIIISKEEYLKNNKKKGGAYMQPNHIGWVVMMHGLTIAPGQSPHREYGQDLPRLPLNVALYLYAPIGKSAISRKSSERQLQLVLCKAACNPDTNGRIMSAIADKGYNISKVEPGSFFYDMYLGGPRGNINIESYGVFRCNEHDNCKPIQQLPNPESTTTLGTIIQNILNTNPGINHSIHIWACRDTSSRNSQKWNNYYNRENNTKIAANSLKLPFSGQLPNKYMPPGLQRGW